MKVPGPDHPITVTPHEGRVVVEHDGAVIVDTVKALVLAESTYPPVFYLPREDAEMSRLTRTSRTSHCPYKGDANYFSLGSVENVVWTYETPFPAMEAITAHLAFYPGKVTIRAA